MRAPGVQKVRKRSGRYRLANPTQRETLLKAHEAATKAAPKTDATHAPGRSEGFGPLALLAGLLWGLNLVKLGLSSNFAMTTEPMGAVAQQGMLASFTLTFLAFALWGQRDGRLFASPRWAAVFGACLVIGSVPLFAPLDALPGAEALSFLFAALHASGNVYFLCALASSVAKLPRHRKVHCLLYAIALACLNPGHRGSTAALGAAPVVPPGSDGFRRRVPSDNPHTSSEHP